MHMQGKAPYIARKCHSTISDIMGASMSKPYINDVALYVHEYIYNIVIYMYIYIILYAW